MTAEPWDADIDAATERARDERLMALAGEFVLDLLGIKPVGPCRCEHCGQICTTADYDQFDGHGPDCPDPSCTTRVCDTRADHSSCETQADRDGREAREWAEAWRDEETDGVIAERREGVER